MYHPIQLCMKANANINGNQFTINGVGVVRSPGVYEATLNFSDLPSNIPPGLLATFLTSACCNGGSSEREGSLNLGHTGVTSYTAHRTISLEDGGAITMTAQASLSDAQIKIEAELSGQISADCSTPSHAIYYITAEPLEAGKKIRGVGEGSIFSCGGKETKVFLDQIYSLEEPQVLPNPLIKNEFRVITEDGTLSGLSYRQRIHSICEPSDVFSRILTMESAF